MTMTPPLGRTSNKPSGTSDYPTGPIDSSATKDLTHWKYSEEGKALLAWVKTEYSKCKSQRLPQQRKWEYNLQMYSGNQYNDLLLDQVIGAQALPAYRIRSVTNLISPIIRTEISRMTSQKPSATVVPVSGSDDDLFAARAGEAVWESLYSRKRMHQMDIRNAFWTVITGNGFRKTYWDDTYKDPTFLTVDPKLEKPRATPGDLCFSVVTPFNLFVPDLLTEDIEDQSYVIEAYTRPVEWVNTFWKPYLAKPVNADVVSKFEVFDSSYFNHNNSKEAVPDSVLIIEAYLKPGGYKLFPNGAMVTIVGNDIVQVYDEWPYTHGEFPHAHTKHLLTGMFYGESILKDIIPLQKEYNRTRNQIIESKIRMARPQLLYEEGSINVRRLTSEPGLAIPYKPGRPPPTPLPLQNLPPFVIDELSILQSNIEDISGQHQVSRGKAPGSGVTAATAISFLQEKDDDLMYATYASIEASHEKIARQSLAIVADKWDLKRIIRTVGSDGSFDSMELKGSDIANGLDIRVEGGSALPTMKAARQALLLDLMKFGAISPEQMLDQLEIGGIKQLVAIIRVDMQQAQRENIKLKKFTAQDAMMADVMWQLQSQPDPTTGLVDEETYDAETGRQFERPPLVPVNEWDNHQVHIEVHNRFRKGQEFEMLPEEIKAEFAKHIRMHEVQMMMTAGLGQDGMMQPMTPDQQTAQMQMPASPEQGEVPTPPEGGSSAPGGASIPDGETNGGGQAEGF